MKTRIIDIGINLMHRQFDEDREAVIKRAADAQVSPLIITGTSLKSSKIAAQYAQRHPGLCYATAGVHPHDAKSCRQDTIDELKKLARLPQVLAIGECGLDYNRDFSPRDVQRNWFEKQIQLADDLQMPLFLHERDAFEDFMVCLKGFQGKAVVHCFTGDESQLQAYLEQGFYIGITGWICDERRGEHLRALVKNIPINRLMIETDAPFLLPRDLPDKPGDRRNEPMYLQHILHTISFCMELDAQDLAKATTDNATSFFQINA